MHIYIDESGAFVPPSHNRPHLYSIVLALVVPSANVDELFYQFLRLRDSWPQQAVEIKGSKLNEDQTAQVMKLLGAHGVIAEYSAIDMALHPSEVIDEFKSRQAALLNQAPHADARRRRGDPYIAIANPLFVQAFVTIKFILEMLDTAINYFAQRRPSELGRFAG